MKTIGEVVKHTGSTNHEPHSHFYHPGLKKICAADMKPHLAYAANVLSRWRAGLDVWPHAKRTKRGI